MARPLSDVLTSVDYHTTQWYSPNAWGEQMILSGLNSLNRRSFPNKWVHCRLRS